ncbi:MAG: hypothetical protein K1X55_15015 [Chitinophagales bacterium]|nr:hypothetical protein [Chitinophagales bacterium]
MLKNYFLLVFVFFQMQKVFSQDTALLTSSIIPESAVAGSVGQWKLYIVPTATVKKNALIKINMIKGWGNFQNLTSFDNGYTRVTTTSHVSKVKILTILEPFKDHDDPWHNDVNQKIITLQIYSGDFIAGDTIVL